MITLPWTQWTSIEVLLLLLNIMIYFLLQAIGVHNIIVVIHKEQ
jgi:hypothetical protein